MPGIYISWPFCQQKCTYCNFASGVHPKELEGQYATALLAEVAAHKWQWDPETLFLGGGTPSGIAPEEMERLFAGLAGKPLAGKPPASKPWREATLEAAPGSFDDQKIEAWQRAGINRVSLGVQSFNQKELARTGRRHTRAIVERDLQLLRAAGISNINLDLIAGLPGQTKESWEDSVAQVIRLGVPHVSVYMLEVDDDSRLGAEILLGGKRYGAVDVPSDDSVASFYEYAVDELERHNIHRYEISNFARPGAESLHNLKYWKREPYIGFGADAHSFDGTRRWQNVESAQEYVSRLLRAESPRGETTDADATEEKFFVGLRLTEGVVTDASDWQRFGAAFERFIEAGVMQQTGSRVRLTPRGVMVSNEVFQEFIAA